MPGRAIAVTRSTTGRRKRPEHPNKEIDMRMFCAAVAVCLVTAASAASAAEPDWSNVAQALGKSGSVLPGGIYKVGLPRTDLQVTLDGVQIKPALALGSWLAFQPMGRE